jgi:hypothetical protein
MKDRHGADPAMPPLIQFAVQCLWLQIFLKGPYYAPFNRRPDPQS